MENIEEASERRIPFRKWEMEGRMRLDKILVGVTMLFGIYSFLSTIFFFTLLPDPNMELNPINRLMMEQGWFPFPIVLLWGGAWLYLLAYMGYARMRNDKRIFWIFLMIIFIIEFIDFSAHITNLITYIQFLYFWR